MKHTAQATIFALALASSPAFSHGDEDSHGANIGKAGKAAKVSRTITVEMNDAMRFNPSSITVRRGETIKFLVKNGGQQKHEMVLGSVKELQEHAELMQKFPQMEHVEPNQVEVDPGKTGKLIWQFTKAGKVDFACLRPGHFEAGMQGSIAVK